MIKKIIFRIAMLFPFARPFYNMFKGNKLIKGLIQYSRDYLQFKKKTGKNDRFRIENKHLLPCIYDRYMDAGSLSYHYFHQDLWAARKIYQSKTEIHYDIGSRIDGFVSHCLIFCKVVLLDVRPMEQEIENLSFIHTDATEMKNIDSETINSLSSLHAVEHFGLGRYGDPVNPQAYISAIREMKRITEKGGNIYFSVPVGEQRIEFNGHRIFNPNYVLELFEGCRLAEFSAVDDENNFIEIADIQEFVHKNFSCGLYHFIKL